MRGAGGGAGAGLGRGAGAGRGGEPPPGRDSSSPSLVLHIRERLWSVVVVALADHFCAENRVGLDAGDRAAVRSLRG